MKKKSKATAILGIAIVAIVAIFGYEALTVTDPYVIKPTSIESVAHGSVPGFTFDQKSGVLSVISTKDIIVVCDPGKSFQYVVTWIVERPREANDSALLDHRYNLTKFAKEDHIHSPDSDIPPEILKVVSNTRWNKG